MKKNIILLIFLVFNIIAFEAISCNYQLKIYSSDGSGWGSRKVSVKVDGNTVLSNKTISQAGPLYFSFSVNAGSSITTNFYGSPYSSSQCEYWILDANGLIVAHQGSNNTAPTSITTPIIVYCPSNIDAGVSRVGYRAVGDSTTYAIVNNYGSNTIFSVTLNWKKNGVSQTPISINSMLNPNDSVIVPLENLSATTQITAYTSSPNGLADQNTYNDTIHTNINTFDFPPTSTWENMLPGLLFPEVSDLTWYSTYHFHQRCLIKSGPPYGGNYGPSVDHTTGTSTGHYLYSSSTYINSTDTCFINSPLLDINNYPAGIKLEFYYYMRGNYVGTLIVQEFDGTHWNTLWAISGKNQTTSSMPWIRKQLTINPGSKQLRIGALGANIAIDDIRLYNPSLIDAELTEIISPVNGSSSGTSFSAIIDIKNAGRSPINNTTVKFSIDNGASYIYEVSNTPINPLDTFTYNFATPINLQMGMYQCIAIVSQAGDTINHNDTIRSNIFLSNPLSGTYTLGSSANTDFENFYQLTKTLKYCGITGPVTILLDSGIYDEKIVFDAIPGASAINTVHIKGQGIKTQFVNTHLILNGNNWSSNVLILNHTKHIIIDSLTFIKPINVPISSYRYSVLSLRNSSDSNKIINSYFNFPNQQSQYNSNYYLLYVSNSSGLTIKNNTFIGGTRGIHIQGSNYSNYPLYYCENTTIENNILIGQKSYPVLLEHFIGCIIKDNNIHMSIQNNYSGIYLLHGQNNMRITGNKLNVEFGYTGINLYDINCNPSQDTILIANNFIRLNKTNNTSSGYGIYNNNAKNIKYYYNSVNITGNSTASRAIYLANGTDSIDLKNNIFTNNAGGYAIYSSVANSNFDNDYNNLFSSGNNLCFINTNILNLASWKTASADAQHSLSIDVLFNSESDLHNMTAPLNNQGSYTALITKDIDGDIRSITTPDIGADEYTPIQDDLSITEYLGIMQSSCGLSSSETIKVVVKNLGSNNQTNMPIKYQLNNGLIITDTISFLSSWAVDTFTFSVNANLSVQGKYHIAVFTDLINDQNRQNDTVNYDIKHTTTIDSFPYYQSFDSVPLEMNLITQSKSTAQITGYCPSYHSSGLFFTSKTQTGWQSSSTIDQAISNNPQHLAKASFCSIDATLLSSLMMKFNIDINSFYNTTDSWFRVMINDTIYAKSINGDSIWNGSSGNYHPLQTKIFDLSSYTGTSFSISLEFVGRTKKVNCSGWGDAVFINSFSLWAPTNIDAGVKSIISPIIKNCGLVNDTMVLSAINYGTDTLNSIPIKIEVTSPSGVLNSINVISQDTIVPNTFNSFSAFPIDFHSSGIYNIKAYTQLSGDTTHFNDTVFHMVTIKQPKSIPFYENFSGNTSLWVSSDFWVNYFNNDMAIYSNAGVNDTVSFKYSLPLGEIDTADYLWFDFLAWMGTPLIPMGFDSVFVIVLSDCGFTQDTVLIIDSLSYIPSYSTFNKATVSLSSFAGSYISIKFVVKRGNTGGDKLYVFDNIVIGPSESVSLGNDTLVCKGQKVNLHCKHIEEASYHWLINGDTLNADTSSISYIVDSNTVVIVEINSPFGIASDTLIIDLYPPISVLLSDTNNLCGLSETHILDAGSNPFYSYLWNTGNTTSAISVDTSIFHGIAAYFKVEVTDTNGCSIGKYSYSRFLPKPYPSLASDTTICYNHIITLNADSGYISYLWNTGDTTISIALDSNIFNVGLNPYIVQVWNEQNCSNTDTIVINVSLCAAFNSTTKTMGKIIIYPNPSNGIFTFKAESIELDDFEMKVVNVSGKEILSKLVKQAYYQDQTYIVDLEGQPSGIYFLVLNSNSESIVIKLIVR